MVQVIATSRAAVSEAHTLGATVPAAALAGDLLVAVIAHAQGSTCVAPTGWVRTDLLGSGADGLSIHATQVEDNEPRSVKFALGGVASEWQGELLALRGASVHTVRESSASIAYADTLTLATAGATSQQAINLLLSVWTCAGSPVLSLPAGFTPVDHFGSAIVSPRSLLIGYRLAGATGALVLPPATATASTTGRSFTFTLRGRVPIEPPALVDVVPGNVGLIGIDTRPAR